MKFAVAIQGVKGSYSEEAARKFFGAKANIVECLNFEETFQIGYFKSDKICRRAVEKQDRRRNYFGNRIFKSH